MIRSLIVVLYLGGMAVSSQRAVAGDPEDRPEESGQESVDGSMRLDSLVASVDVVDIAPSDTGWNLTVSLREVRDRVSADDAVWQIEVYGSERRLSARSAQGSEVTIEVDSASLTDGEHLMLAVQLIASEETGIGYRYFQRRGAALVEESLEAYLHGRSDSFPSGRVFVGATSVARPDAENEHLPPWENPEVRPEDQAWSRAQASAETDDDAVAMQSAALQARATTTEEADVGCGAGPLAGALTVLPFIALLMLRRRASALVLLLVTIGGVSEVRATIVYGYVGFWDSRTGSNYPGSRLGTCNTSDYTCGVGASNCCTRGIPYVEVTMRKKDGTVVATAQSTLSGYFQFPNTTYTSATYDLVVTYTRGSSLTSQVITENATGSVPFSSYAAIGITQPSGSYLNLGSRRVNAAPDGASKEGNFATAWHGLTYSFYYLEAENEYRQRKVLGSPNTYDQIVFRYRTSATPACPSTDWFPPSESRLVSMHEHAGLILLGRTVGCDNGLPSYPIPAWPTTALSYQNPTLQPTSESAALAVGIRRLVSMISRFAPAVTSASNAGSGTGINCTTEFSGSTDLYPNSNSAAWPNHNARALWELIDSDTSGADDGVSDSVNTDLHTIMNAVAANASATGSPGQNRTVQEYAAVVTPYFCSSNESCSSGYACYSNQSKCYSPDANGADPHAGNIGDLAAYLPGGIGNVADTIKSSPCMRGGPVDSYPYSGSYQDL